MFAEKNMKIIVDCGSTKADWVVLDKNEIVLTFETEGFNPNYTDVKYISSIILNELAYKPYIQYITNVYFYGTGCGNAANCELLRQILKSIFIEAEVTVTHDIMAACHALFGRNEGIACILGTGSNSCYYDGNDIVDKAVSLGYIIGDEGSGCDIGKVLLRHYFYGKMPENISEKFENEYKPNIAAVIDNIYHKPQSSKYLATFSKFAYDNKDDDYVKNICVKCFDEFIDTFILRYKNAENLKIGFVGSIAYYFQDLLRDCLKNKGLTMGNVIKKPIEGLIEYHVSY